MIIKEIQLLSKGLWESVQNDSKFFSPIFSFTRQLAEFDYLDFSNIDEVYIYIDKIEEFFESYRPKGSSLYFPPHQTTNNDRTVKRILELSNQLKHLSNIELEIEVSRLRKTEPPNHLKPNKIFIGHGRSKLWALLQIYLQEELKLGTICFESESRTSETIVNILETFLSESSFAILILTAEDETAEGKLRARQNVIHEIGLFQGRLGFKNVILLKQDKAEDFSNIAGLQYIAFNGDNIDQTFYQLHKALKKAGLLK
ncbi:putative nucleotide-binding protein [Mucilaginibacter rubeus]|uniref:nucleotide-binding protein n=1 Tax=Mucilaginibacter rubeus TaxID=2027860 RepID=UPI003392FD79